MIISSLATASPKALATAIANAAQDKNEQYQFNGFVKGNVVTLVGEGYFLSLFLINGADYSTTPDQFQTRKPFKQYIINSILEA